MRFVPATVAHGQLGRAQPAGTARQPVRGRWLRLIPPLTLGLFLGPILAGLLGTILPAFGYLPALGGERLALAPWRQLFAAPGLQAASQLSLMTGLLATAIALALTILAFAAGQGTRAFRRARRLMAPLLAVPHLATAIGLAFLLAPSGWLVRLITPWLTGWQTPPDMSLLQGPYGFGLTLGLVVKETPFLILMTFAGLGQVHADRHLRQARAFGYGRIQAWLKVVLPLVYPQIRLPIYAVLAYSLSVVDMAIVLGPTTPPTLAPLILRWFSDPDLTLRFQAAAGACLQMLLVLLAIAAWRLAELLIARLARPWLTSGGRGGSGRLGHWLAWLCLGVVTLLAIGGLFALAVWSVAGAWRFPAAWPAELTLATWARHLDLLARPIATTLLVGLAATLLALGLVLGCLEQEQVSRKPPGQGALLLLYLPLLVPQISFLFGLQVILVRLGLDGTWLGLIWAHLLFVLPYLFLTLAEPYRSLDRRYETSALALGKPHWQVWWRIRLALLLRPVLIAAAIGFAVSVGQFLPTQMVGGGRLVTLTTEALALANGADRRLVGMVALSLAVLPLVAFAVALALPAWRFRHRRGMASGG